VRLLDSAATSRRWAAPRAGSTGPLRDDRTVLGALGLDGSTSYRRSRTSCPGPTPWATSRWVAWGCRSRDRRRLSGPDGTSRPRQRRGRAHTRLQRCSPRRLRQPSSLRRPDRRRRVTVDGEIAVLGQRIDPEVAVVAVDGSAWEARPARHYALNKPAGVVTPPRTPGSPHRARARPRRARVFAWADWTSTPRAAAPHERRRPGQALTTPPRVDKEYLAEVEASPARCTPALRQGVELDDGRTAPATVGVVSPGVLRIVIHEGRNRQVRRMCETVGHPCAAWCGPASGRSRTGRCGQGSSGSSPGRGALARVAAAGGELATRGPFGRPSARCSISARCPSSKCASPARCDDGGRGYARQIAERVQNSCVP